MNTALIVGAGRVEVKVRVFLLLLYHSSLDITGNIED